MSENYHIDEILKKLKEYKRKYYVNKLIKGILINLTIFLVILLASSWLEYELQMSSVFRTAIFAFIGSISFYFIIRYILQPIYHLGTNAKSLSDEQAAREIGRYFPEIDDKLLNIIQLINNSAQQNALIRASIVQKSEKISILNFKDSIDIKASNKTYIPYLLIPSVILILVLLFAPNMITEGSYRIIKFNEEFIPEAPFNFHIENDELQAFKGESFLITARLSGQEIPSELYVQKEGVKQRLEKISGNQYQFNFKNLQEDLVFFLEAAGFRSMQYKIHVFERPRIQNMNIGLDYPDYTGATSERIDNSGNLIVPEGTKAEWLISSNTSDRITLIQEEDSSSFIKTNTQTFKQSQYLLQSQGYTLALFNERSGFIQNVEYSIEVIKDKFPEINLEPINDSIYYQQIALAGEISDDYGFSNLRINYKKFQNGTEIDRGKIPLNFDKSILNQKYFKLWSIDSLITEKDVQLEYFIEVADNDGINGSKYSKTATQIFQLPSDDRINEAIRKTSQSTENQLDKNIDASKNVNSKLEELEKILKTKSRLNWEDKKLIEEIFKEREQQRQELEKIKNQLNKNQAKRDRFNKQDSDLRKKSEQLESLMEEMLQDENEELLEKIKSLMEDQQKSDDIRESVEDLKKQEKNRLKEMERLMELFKRMEIQYDMKQVGEKFEELSQKQQSLAEKNKAEEQKSKQSKTPDDLKEDNEDKFNSQQEQNDALEEQKEVNKAFEQLQQQLREIEERNQSLKQPNALKDTKEQESEIDLSQQESQQEIQENNKQGASEQQERSSEKMKEMSEMLSSMQMGMEMEMLQENIDDLKDIVDNLLKLSFRQEELMNNFKTVNPNDPRFISLSEKQLAMKDDAKIIEDSLTTLSERVFQLESFITKEMSKMNESMQSSIDALKIRENGKAIGEQQFAMTSMNNLALMLDDVLEQMQMQMQSSMGMGQQSQGNQQTPSLSDMQKSLNQKTKELSEGQKSGRQFSEKLGELAAEQAKLRKMMQEMEKQGEGEQGQESGGNSGSIGEEMEKIEEELVNKRLNRSLIQRQEQIVTRLLESERAREEQEEKDERKGETATDYNRDRIPNAFEEYIKQKTTEIERLRNVPPNFTPYYKNEINKYYNRLKSKENLMP